jgi:hypothetical protein
VIVPQRNLYTKPTRHDLVRVTVVCCNMGVKLMEAHYQPRSLLDPIDRMVQSRRGTVSVIFAINCSVPLRPGRRTNTGPQWSRVPD